MPYIIADLEARLGDPHLLDAGAPLPHDTAFEIAALYDPDGDIDSKDGQVRASAPARRGDLAIRMELGTP
jgi:hypothetical protein